MKKVQGGILIWDVLFLTAAILTSVIAVFLGIEMADAGTHRIKLANLWRFYGKTVSSKTRLQDLKKNSNLNSNDIVSILKTRTILFILLMFAWRVWGRYNFYRLRRSNGGGKLPKILESKNQFQHATHGPDIFSGNAVQTRSVFWHTSRYIIKLIVESQVASDNNGVDV